MTNSIDGDENCIVGNTWEDVRPCYTHKGGDICAKLVYAVLSKYNPAISNNDVNNDLKKLEQESLLYKTMLDIRQRMPVAVFNKEQVNYIFGMNEHSNPTLLRRYIRNAVKKLASETFIINKEGGGIAIYGVFPRIEYTPEDDEHTLTAEFNYSLLPYVLDLRGQIYTTIPLNEIRLLSSDYAMKLYTFCMRYDKLRTDEYNYKKEIAVDKLRTILCVSSGYSGKDFNRRILDKYTEEITKKTSWNIKWEGKYNGRKITKYIFFVTAKNQPAKREFVETIAGRGIDTSLINDENKEIVLYLAKKGVNKKQIFEVYHNYGINYMKFLTEKVDIYYATKIAKEVAYFENDCYYDKLTNKKISYGAIWNGAKRSWLSYDKWAKDNADIIAKEKEEKKQKQKQEAVEADEAVKKQDKIKEEKRKRLRSFEQFKNYTDSQLDNFIDICNSVLDTKEIKQEVKEIKEVKKAKKKDLSTVNNMLLDYFVNEDFDVKKLLSHSYNIYFKMEQDKAGYDDFDDFVNDVKEAYYRGELD